MSSIYRLTMPTTYLKLMARSLSSINLRKLLEGTGLTEADLVTKEGFFTVKQQLRAVRNMMAIAHRPDWHFEWLTAVAERYHGPVTRALLSAPTLGDGIDAYVRYIPLRIPYLEWATRFEGDSFRVEVRPLVSLGPPQPVLLEGPLLMLLAYVRTMCIGMAKKPKIDLEHRPITEFSCYTQWFDCNFAFETTRNSLTLPAAWRRIVNIEHDPQSWAAAIRQCENVGSIDANLATVDLVVRMLTDVLASPDKVPVVPTLGAMASYLNLSVRTMNRRLKLANTTYQALIDGVRKDLALELLLDKSVKISQVAEKLGFGDPGALCRAFKRWYMTSPRAYRPANIFERGQSLQIPPHRS